MSVEKPIALFIGRFQPFHKGHLLALKWIARRSGKIIIAIGSAQCGNEPKNPFTSRERGRMIRAQVSKNGLAKKCSIVSVTDVNNDEKWVSHLDASVPLYDVAYSNNPLVKRLMKKAGKRVLPIPFFRKGDYNATKIRGRMRSRRQWQDRVPRGVLSMLRALHAEERIRKMPPAAHSSKKKP